MRLLEREDVLESLAEYAQAARTGAGRLVLVSGEAGVGKTALVDEFERTEPAARWGRGACDGLFTPRPLGPLFDIAEQFGGDLLAACRNDGHREDLFAVLLRELDQTGRLTVLIVEDAHWADESTLDLLSFLGRRIGKLPAMLLVTYRDDSLAPDHPLRVVLGDLATQRSTRRIGVAPLTEKAVGTLAADTHVAPHELYRLTGGNPFFVTEVLHTASGEIPPSARDAVLARAAGLSATARHAAETAALIGAHVETRVLETAAPATAADIDELLGAGILVSDVAALHFRHELTRLAVESAIPAHRRVAVHGRVLAALGGHACTDDARLAYHADGADDRDAVLHFAPRAAERAAGLGAHREAAAQYERALRFADEAERRVAAGLNDRLARECSLIDAWERAAAAGERALALWREVGDPLRIGDTQRLLSTTMWRLCRGPESLAYAEASLATLRPVGESPELARSYITVAGARANHGSPSARETAVQAQRLAELLALPDVLSDALNTEACIAADEGDEWQSRMRRSLDIAINAGLDQQAGRAFANLHETLRKFKLFAEAERVYLDGTAYCDDHDIATFDTCLRSGEGQLLLHVGRWDEAVDICTRMLARLEISPANRVIPLLTLGQVLARRGDPGWSAHLDEAVAIADRTEEHGWIVEAHPPRAEAYWLAGDADCARLDLEIAVQHIASKDPWMRGLLATWCRRVGLPLSPGTEPVAEPHALVLAGDFDAAVRAWDRLSCPFDAGLAAFDSGTEAGLRDAVRRFDALGAHAAAQAARRRMRRRGMRAIPSGARASTRSDPHGLTRREREVLELICSGSTNGEIARKLYISARTVDHHVSAVLAKLGAPSRGAAAAAARRNGLVGT